jgi:hypothetical protein
MSEQAAAFNPLERVCIPSGLSGVNDWVEALELDPGIGRGEAPGDGGDGLVARPRPGPHLPRQRRPITEPPVQALAVQHAELELGQVEPTAVLGGGGQLQPVGQPFGLGRERLIERSRGVGGELVHDQHDPLGLGVVAIDQLLDAVGEVEAGALVAEADLAPAAPRLGDEEAVDHPAPLVLRIVAGRPARR